MLTNNYKLLMYYSLPLTKTFNLKEIYNHVNDFSTFFILFMMILNLKK